MRTTTSAGIRILAAMGLLLGAMPAAAQELDCIMLPREIVTVSAPVEGVVDRVFVERGDVIEAGAVLAELESSMERSALAIAEARARQDYGVKAHEVRAAYGARRFQRIEGLFDQAMVPLKDRDEAMTLKVLADYELVKHVVAVVIFMFLPYCQVADANVTVDVFTERASDTAKAVMAFVSSLLAIAFAALLLRQMWLGWLSYTNNNIWLGFFLHCSVALLMDVLALYQKKLLF